MRKYKNNNILLIKFYERGLERAKCMQTLSLSHGNRKVIFKKSSTQMYLSQIKEK